jgi:hypothetical protein
VCFDQFVHLKNTGILKHKVTESFRFVLSKVNHLQKLRIPHGDPSPHEFFILFSDGHLRRGGCEAAPTVWPVDLSVGPARKLVMQRLMKS